MAHVQYFNLNLGPQNNATRIWIDSRAHKKQQQEITLCIYLNSEHDTMKAHVALVKFGDKKTNSMGEMKRTNVSMI